MKWAIAALLLITVSCKQRRTESATQAVVPRQQVMEYKDNEIDSMLKVAKVKRYQSANETPETIRNEAIELIQQLDSKEYSKRESTQKAIEAKLKTQEAFWPYYFTLLEVQKRGTAEQVRRVEKILASITTDEQSFRKEVTSILQQKHDLKPLYAETFDEVLALIQEMGAKNFLTLLWQATGESMIYYFIDAGEPRVKDFAMTDGNQKTDIPKVPAISEQEQKTAREELKRKFGTIRSFVNLDFVKLEPYHPRAEMAQIDTKSNVTVAFAILEVMEGDKLAKGALDELLSGSFTFNLKVQQQVVVPLNEIKDAPSTYFFGIQDEKAQFVTSIDAIQFRCGKGEAAASNDRMKITDMFFDRVFDRLAAKSTFPAVPTPPKTAVPALTSFWYAGFDLSAKWKSRWVGRHPFCHKSHSV